jgi:nucleotide-binding universal stress UspA family protein
MRECKRILCPLDFSDASSHAIEQAIAIAGWCKARTTALHVYSPALPRAWDTSPLREALVASAAQSSPDMIGAR